MTLHKILRLLAVVAALIAAALWYHASIIPIPTALRVVDITADGAGVVAGIKEMSDGLLAQGLWNARAALMTAVAVVLDIVARAFAPN